MRVSEVNAGECWLLVSEVNVNIVKNFISSPVKDFSETLKKKFSVMADEDEWFDNCIEYDDEEKENQYANDANKVGKQPKTQKPTKEQFEKISEFCRGKNIFFVL